MQSVLIKSKLAILGGEPLRKRPFAPWPQFKVSDVKRVAKVIGLKRRQAKAA